jgi:hypothetical protein
MPLRRCICQGGGLGPKAQQEALSPISIPYLLSDLSSGPTPYRSAEQAS